MERYFASLSKRQTMLLLTAVTLGGQDCLAALEHLPEAEAELLKHRAGEMLQIPREKRIPLLVQEIKRLVATRRRHLSAADPARLAALLSKERGSLVEMVLRALPAGLCEQVRAHLPARELAFTKEVKPEILTIVRWKLEANLYRWVPKKGVFKFSDVLILQARELLSICDRMGARALSTAMAGLAEPEREAFFAALPPDQRTLAQKAAEAGRSRALSETDARAVLEMHGGLKDPSQGMRGAGVQRLARACLAQGAEFATRVVDQHPGELGRLLGRWVREELNRPPSQGDGGRADIVEQMERLAQKGVIDRPMRLPPPPRRPADAAPAPMPGGQLLPPKPKAVPERQAFRDPIAERERRRAGVAPPVERPPSRVLPGPKQAAPGTTTVTRPPRAHPGSGRALLKGPERGPKGGSG